MKALSAVLRTASKKEPPQPLVPRLPPSSRHPKQGLPRCQRWRIRDGVFHQCKRAAREGFRTCGHHGAGFAAREERGERKNPARVRIVNGEHAKPETLDVLGRDYPDIWALNYLKEITQDVRQRLRAEKERRRA